jgi:hypothetical protein
VNEIDRCRPWIEAALQYSGGTHTFDDVADMIATGRLQLWPAMHGCLVTEIVDYPQKRVFNVFLAGGTLAQLFDMDPDVVTWARAMGCTAATLHGRRGWTRALTELGWRETLTTMEKDL